MLGADEITSRYPPVLELKKQREAAGNRLLIGLAGLQGSMVGLKTGLLG